MNPTTLETQVLVRSVRSFITGRRDAELDQLMQGGVDIRALLEQSRANKLGVMLWAGLKLNLECVPPEIEAGLRAYQAAMVQKNAANLTTLRHVVPLLETGGIEVVVLKGPAHQQLIYGNYFSKPAVDVDLLVREKDYDRAAGLLLQDGFVLPKSCDTPWWRHFLGEQPFLPESRSRVTVDLHHRTQQPGCPAPRNDGYFMEGVERISVGGVQIPALSRTKATALSCMNVVKAIFHREPAGGYVCDVAAALHAGGPGEIERLLAVAERQGLRNTMLFGLRCAAALLGTPGPATRPEAGQGFLHAPEPDLLWMTFVAGADSPGWPKRRRMLWDLCDNKADYPRELSWAAAGEAFRRMSETPPARLSSPVTDPAGPPQPAASPAGLDRSCAVIITARNAEATIAKSVASALAQAAAAEVVVVDDGSTDTTGAVAASMDDGSGRLKIIRLEVNRGPSSGRNVAIAASTAPFICVLDADDFMGAGRLDALFEKGGPDWDLLADDMLFTAGPSESEVFDRLLPADFEIPTHLSLEVFVTGNLPRPERYRRELGFLKPLIRRSFLEQHRLVYDERLRLGEDFILYAECLLAGGRFKLVDSCGYYAVERPESLSGSHRTSDIADMHGALRELMERSAAAGRTAGLALKPKAISIRRNLAFRRALDAKRNGDWPGVVAAIADSPGGALHILTETVRAKLADRRRA